MLEKKKQNQNIKLQSVNFFRVVDTKNVLKIFKFLFFVKSFSYYFFNKLKIYYRGLSKGLFNNLSYCKNYIFLFMFLQKFICVPTFVYFRMHICIKNYSNFIFLNRRKLNIMFLFLKLIKWFYQIFWFNLHTMFAKYIIMFTLKNIFFTTVYRDIYLGNNINIYFFETKKIEFLTATLVSNYIVRNLKAGHNLNRIIYPLLRNLERAKLYNGWKIGCSGRFKRRGRAQRSWFGRRGVALNTIISNIDFAQQIVRLRNGVCCVKVFLSRKNKYIYI